MGPSSTFIVSILVVALFSAVGTGCARTRVNETQTPVSPPAAKVAVQTEDIENDDLEDLVKRLNRKVTVLEQQLASVNLKLKATQVGLENIKSLKGPIRSGVVAPPIHGSGKKLPTTQVKKTGFTNDNAVQHYRDAMVLFDSDQFDDSIVKFSEFLQTYPDHVLAGSAQYHLGESYFKRGEFKLAVPEFRRVLVAYDSSSFVPDALLRLFQAQTKLNQANEAETHKQQLLTLFPESPAAKNLMNVKGDPPKAKPTSKAPEAVIPKVKRFLAGSQIDEPPPTAPLPGVVEDGSN